MKATEQNFTVVLFIMLYKAVLTYESVDEMLSVTIQMKAIEKFFLVVRCYSVQGGSCECKDTFLTLWALK